MRVLIRTDASIEIGSGHLMRCLTLADQLRVTGADIAFACSDQPGALFDVLQARGYRSARLPLAADGDAPQHLDAEETVKAAGRLFPTGIDWLVVDHYQLDAVWERKLRPHSRKIMVIDDLANRHHECDLLLDQNYESPARYKGLVPANCRMLLGPGFALLRDEFADYRKSMKPRSADVRRVLVFFGGTDQYNMTGLSLDALSSPELSHLQVDLVVGANYKYRAELDRQAAGRPHTAIHGPRPHLADLMAQADLAIGGGGVTNWERMCLGLPSLVVTLAENQVPISNILDSEGAIRLLGSAEELTAEDIRNGLIEEIESRRYIGRVELAMKQCDGLGCPRVIRALIDTN